MRILGVDLRGGTAASRAGASALVLLEPDGRVAQTSWAATLPELALRVGELAAGEPFLLGVDAPIVVPAKLTRGRPVENLVRRRLGVRLPAAGRATLGASPQGVVGEALIAGLAAAGLPCLPFPDRDRVRSGLLEAYPELTLKTLLWDASPMSAWSERDDLAELFRGYPVPEYRADRVGGRAGWATQAALVEQAVRGIAAPKGFDTAPVLAALERAGSPRDVERAAALFDAILVASTARRYLDNPDHCVFVGDHENGYVVLPADGLVRRLVAARRAAHGQLFPQVSLRDRLGPTARLRSVDLFSLPGKPQRLEASFADGPDYEFDNVDEMLWWKHARHVAGPQLPVEGLHDLIVDLAAARGREPETLHLVRSRHRTLSFRFDPPAAWRAHVPTRDGRTYRFRVLRATYETAPGRE